VVFDFIFQVINKIRQNYSLPLTYIRKYNLFGYKLVQNKDFDIWN